MFDHVGIPVSDYAKSKQFYETVLASLGHVLVMEHPGAGSGFGSNGIPSFWISEGESSHSVHIAFAAPDRATVDKFYEVAIKAGAVCNGPPGLRPVYHPTYYGAFVLDPDGNNIEAVCHG